MFIPLLFSLLLSDILCQQVDNGEPIPGAIPPPGAEKSNDVEGPNEPETGKPNLWLDGIIPFDFPMIPGLYFSENAKQLINRHIEKFNELSCVKFVRMSEPAANFIEFVKVPPNAECQSLGIGMAGGEQFILLNEEHCLDYRTVAHHLMHAAGFYNQHQTMNRDKYIDVQWDNIVDRNAHLFLRKRTATVQDEPYDFKSIMHFPSLAYSKNMKPTIVAKNGGALEAGGNVELSETDVQRLKQLYQCESKDKKEVQPKSLRERYPYME